MKARFAQAGLLGLMALAVLTTMLSIWGFLLFPDKTDLLARYKEGAAWLNGAPLYQPHPSVNMFPPWVTMLVFAPMSRVPFRVVQLACVGLNAAALVLALRATVRTLRLSAGRTVVMSAMLLSLHGMSQSWMLGQFTGLLLFAMTRSWIAFREGRPGVAAAWLAPLIALKPTFAVLALMLPVRVWLLAGLLSLAMTLLGVAATGWEVWRAWMAAGATVNWLPFAFNASLWGMAARSQFPGVSEVSLSDLSPLVTAAVLILIAAMAVHAMTRSNPDRRFFFATVVSILASPLGWIYYIPLAAGPATATWPRSVFAATACAVLMSPMIGNLHGAGPLLGSMYFAALAGVWLAWCRSRPSAIPFDPERPSPAGLLR